MKCSRCRRSLLLPVPALVVLGATFVIAALVVWQFYVGLGLGVAASAALVIVAWPAGYSITRAWDAYEDAKKARGPKSPFSTAATDAADGA